MVEDKTEKAGKPNWIKMKPAELESLVVDLGKKGETPAKIGIILRDQHGIPKSKLIGKRISQIMKDNSINIKSERDIVKDKIQKLERHIKIHKHDYTSARSLTKKLWIVHKLSKQTSAT